jgi:NAD(P)H-flavin reductase
MYFFAKSRLEATCKIKIHVRDDAGGQASKQVKKKSEEGKMTKKKKSG